MPDSGEIRKEYYQHFDGDLDEKAYYSDLFVQKFWQRKKIDDVLKFIGSNCLILDIGSGSGMISKFASEKNIVVPFDISKKCISNSLKLNPSLFGVVGDAMEIPFKDNSFDTIICVELIEHLQNPDKCMNEIHRVLKDNGNLIMTTPNYRSFWPLLEFLWDEFGRGRNYRFQHISKFNIDSIKNTLTKYNFRIKSIRTTFLFTPFIAIFSEELAKLALSIESKLLNYLKIGMLITVFCEKIS